MQISELYGSDNELYQRLISSIGFGIHVALPCVVQSYDADKQTIEAQPTIRERTIELNGIVKYVQYPLLINVPILFQQVGGYIISFPIKKGDECLVIFSDLSIDNWWLKGNVQNPVEIRRHDLSDGIAIFGLKNQEKLSLEKTKPSENCLSLLNTETGNAIEISEEGIKFNTTKYTTTIDSIVARLNNHEERIAALEEIVG